MGLRLARNHLTPILVDLKVFRIGVADESTETFPSVFDVEKGLWSYRANDEGTR